MFTTHTSVRPRSRHGLGPTQPRTGSSRLNDKIKNYLTARFDLGDQTGRKADPQQVFVAVGVRNLPYPFLRGQPLNDRKRPSFYRKRIHLKMHTFENSRRMRMCKEGCGIFYLRICVFERFSVHGENSGKL